MLVGDRSQGTGQPPHLHPTAPGCLRGCSCRSPWAAKGSCKYEQGQELQLYSPEVGLA